MSETIGIIGVGHLAGYLVQGLRHGGFAGDILLSPRNHEKAAALATDYDCRVARDNGQVVEGAEAVILTVKPPQVSEALAGLAFRPGQLLLSACAGVGLGTLQGLVGAGTVVRAMPLSAAAIGRSPTVLFPQHETAAEILSLLGQVHPCQSEAQFEAACVNGAVYAWLFALFARLEEANRAAGLPPELARQMTLETAAAAAGMAQSQEDLSLDQIIASLATEGGISARGLATLEERGALSAWREAFDRIHDHLLVASNSRPSGS